MALGQGKKNGPTQSPNKTPAPSRDFGSAGQAYGANQYAGPSSIPPGTAVSAALDPLGNDPVLDIVKSRGVRKDDAPTNFQIRTESDRPYPNASGMKNPNNPAEKVPGSVDWHNAPGPAPRPKGE